MTDYNKWGKYNVETEIMKIDHESDESSATRIESQLKKQSSVLTQVNELAEALVSKAAVEELKAKGVMHRRRRQQTKENSISQDVIDTSTDQREKVIEQQEIYNADDGSKLLRRISEIVRDITNQLSELMQVMETLNKHMNERKKHKEGYILSISTLERLHRFNRDKFQLITILNGASNNDDAIKLKAVESTKVFMDGIESSGQYLSSQIAEYITVFSLNIGDYAMACDFARYRIKFQSSEMQNAERTWLLRALSFAGMGEMKLSRRQVSQAKRVNKDYFTIDDTESYLQQLEMREAKANRNMNIEVRPNQLDTESYFYCALCQKRVIFSTVRALYLHKHNERVVRNKKEDNMRRCLSLSDFITKECLQEYTMDEQYPYKKFESITDFLEYFKSNGFDDCDINPDPSNQADVFVVLSRRMFYEAQILYLESYFLSAEIKYWSTLAMADLALHFDSNLRQRMDPLIHSCLLNIVNCRIKRFCFQPTNSSLGYCHPMIAHFQPYEDISHDEEREDVQPSEPQNTSTVTQEQYFIETALERLSISACMTKTTLEICDLCTASFDSVCSRFRKVLVLESMERYRDAMKELGELNDRCTNDHSIEYLSRTMKMFVLQHDERNPMSQRFMSGVLDSNTIIGFHTINTDSLTVENDPFKMDSTVDAFRDRCLKSITAKETRLEYLLATFGQLEVS